MNSGIFTPRIILPQEAPAVALPPAPGGLVSAAQAPTGIARKIINGCSDNAVSWQNVINFPQPGQQSVLDGLGVVLMFRLQPNAQFFSGAAEALKLIARIQWGIGNDFDLAVIDVPSNSNIRIPLTTANVIVDVATVLCQPAYALFNAQGSAPADFFENVPASQFRKAVSTGTGPPILSAGIMGGAGYGPSNSGLPQRQIELLVPPSSSAYVPRPSAAANFQYMQGIANAFTVAQVGFGSNTFLANGPNLSNKLLTDGFDVLAVNTSATVTQPICVSFDIVF